MDPFFRDLLRQALDRATSVSIAAPVRLRMVRLVAHVVRELGDQLDEATITLVRGLTLGTVAPVEPGESAPAKVAS